MNKRILALLLAVGIMLVVHEGAIALTWAGSAAQSARSTVAVKTSLSGEVVRQVNRERTGRGLGALRVILYVHS